MKLIAFAFIAACLFAAQSAGAGMSNNPCENRPDLLKTLEAEGMEQVASGLDRMQDVIEIFTNPETGEWTMVSTLPSGVSCPIAQGEAFKMGKPGEPS